MKTPSTKYQTLQKETAPSISKEQLLKREENLNQKNTGESELSIDIRDVPGKTYTGTEGQDTINYLGMYGDDTMIGSPGADYFNGGAGVDTVDYSASNPYEGISVNLTDERGWYGGDAEGDVLINVENVIGSEGNDTFVGSEADNTFHGNGGYDTFHTDAGADTYYGGADGGVIWAGGNDMTIDLMLGEGRGGEAEGDRYFDIDDVRISGNDNTVFGSMEDNTVTVNGVDNSVSLLGGNDTLSFGSPTFLELIGSSSFDGGTGTDTLDLSGLVSPSVISAVNIVDLDSGILKGDRSSGPQVGEASKIANFENVIGSDGIDVITDNGSDNVFTGNGGADVFRFIHQDSDESDTITDFTAGVDKIDLTKVPGLEAIAGFGDALEFGGFKIEVENAVDILTELGEQIDLPSGISFAYHKGDDVVIYTDFAEGNTITLEGVDIQDMSADDFIL